MNKRDFILASGSLALAGLPAIGHAADSLVAGKDYTVYDPPIRTEAPAGKIEVLEFFWYACPHCYSLEPVITDWASRLPADVDFRRVHVAFRGDQHQHIYYTLLAMGKTAEFDGKVFEAIHKQRKRMYDEGEIFDWAAENGLDRAAFEGAWNSFGVRTQMNKAKQMITAYHVEGVPMMTVNGKYKTAPSMAGSNGRALEIIDALVARER
ncbi:MAG: thiol:disulfide interchange protein DsbA/DsbL [Burkholderiaceae bacterium]